MNSIIVSLGGIIFIVILVILVLILISCVKIDIRIGRRLLSSNGSAHT